MQKKLSLKSWFIIDEIFKANLSFLIGDWGTYCKHLEALGIGDNDNDRDKRLPPKGHSIFEKNCFIVYLREWDLETLVHELIHHTIAVFSDRGIIAGADNQEAMAYYMEMVFRKVNEAVRTKPRLIE